MIPIESSLQRVPSSFLILLLKELAQAYEVLSDPEKREIYDEYGDDALKEGLNSEPPIDDMIEDHDTTFVLYISVTCLRLWRRLLRRRQQAVSLREPCRRQFSTDGHIIPDYLAELMGIPRIPPILRSSAEDLSHGASFAMADATVLGSPLKTMLLNRGCYSPKISHRELVEMAEHRKELEKMAKPVLDTLRSYQDLPPFHVNDQAAIEMVKGRRSNIQKKL
ncbi:Chaperone J-domain superfamily [Arabidopsis suecica]|uniref:Chaperone J-domain superfamily n=1 Tax=Arabidopsis suecica TaxID=45249 RepID=A0A8T2BRR0_ARASU|nr:Chaperone J-domain superfamily [Arabidopsis suecica]